MIIGVIGSGPVGAASALTFLRAGFSVRLFDLGYSLGIEGAWLASSPVLNDDRGSFREWFKSSEITSSTGMDFSVAQANLSESKGGVVRGIHYSLASTGQAKWITCVTGAIKDVVVDIRPKSPTFRKHVVVDLQSGDGRAILIGPFLGHGFVSMLDGTTVAYLVSSQFSQLEEFEINPLDPNINIEWGLPVNELLLSKKDEIAPNLEERAKQNQLPN